MNRVTIVCCYNNGKQFEEFQRALSEQTEQVVLIGINNTNSTFSSCASAFNSISDQLETEYVIYSHQDIEFENSYALEKIVYYLEKTDKDDIVGVAGVRINEKSSYTNIFHGINNKRYAGKFRVSGIEECESVDECFFGGHSAHFREFKFDEKLCNNWHLYAVEQCLRAKKNGNKVWVCEADLYHNSDGIHNEMLHKNFRDLSKAYSRDFKYICAPCCRGRTDFIRRNWGYYKRNKKLGIKVKPFVLRKLLGLIDKLSGKIKLVKYILYGEELFK